MQLEMERDLVLGLNERFLFTFEQRVVKAYDTEDKNKFFGFFSTGYANPFL
jgi:hypothetical protein